MVRRRERGREADIYVYILRQKKIRERGRKRGEMLGEKTQE